MTRERQTKTWEKTGKITKQRFSTESILFFKEVLLILFIIYERTLVIITRRDAVF